MKKSNEAYKSIGEVAKILNLINKKNGSLNTHTIRFWEKEFKSVNPIILAGRRRYYDEKSIEVLKKIKFLLKNQGMTIKGAKRALGTIDSFNLDDSINKSIKVSKKNLVLKKKVTKISKLIKEIKDLK
jgi:DNA-binding transcriptional MerR regulator